MVNEHNLYDLHMSCVRKSCIALSTLFNDVISDRSTNLRLKQLTYRLHGSSKDESTDLQLGSVKNALHLISATRSSINLLSESQQFNEEGEGIADELRKTLDTIENSFGQYTRQKIRSLIHGLYVIIDPQITGGREPLHIAQETLEGGARILQLRDKIRDKGAGLDLMRSIKHLCDNRGALFIVNDHPDIATVVQANGVHLGQGDLPISTAREVLSSTQIVGRSNHSLEEAIESERQGADYIAVGAMYPTFSKNQPIVGGLRLLRQVKESVQTPVVAIGGITQEHMEDVVTAGADAVCVISLVGLAQDPKDITHKLVESIRSAGGKA